MEKNNKTLKYLAIISLLVSVIGISLGFAAFSSTLRIVATADVSPSSTLYSGGTLSINSNTVTTGNVTATTTGGATADVATLTESNIQNINAHFTEPGQTATYSFYSINGSEFNSYLNSIVFGTKTCTPASGTTAEYAQAACNDITMTVSAGSSSFTETNNNISSHAITSGSYEPIAVTITYAPDGAVADGDFSVNFGTTSLTYGTVD